MLVLSDCALHAIPGRKILVIYMSMKIVPLKVGPVVKGWEGYVLRTDVR